MKFNFTGKERFVDLSHPLHAGDPGYPGDPPLACTPHATIDEDGYRLSRLSLGSHAGTHVDAPSHFLAQGDSIESWPLDVLIGPAWVIDVPCQDRALIEIEHFLPHADKITPGCRLLLRTGHSVHYPSAKYWEDYPGLSTSAALWLRERRVALLGFDTPSPSHDTHSVHEILLDGSPPTAIVESLARLDELPPRVLVIVLPLAWAGLDGAPARSVAIFTE